MHVSLRVVGSPVFVAVKGSVEEKEVREQARWLWFCMLRLGGQVRVANLSFPAMASSKLSRRELVVLHGEFCALFDFEDLDGDIGGLAVVGPLQWF